MPFRDESDVLLPIEGMGLPELREKARFHVDALRRFASTTSVLLLASTPLCGCGARTGLHPDDASIPGATDDAMPESAQEGQVTDPSDETASQAGYCHFGGRMVTCAAGDTCRANYVVGPSPTVCIISGDPAKPCGLIFCGELCECESVAASICTCS